MKQALVLLGLSALFLSGCQLQLQVDSTQRKISLEDASTDQGSTGQGGDCQLPVAGGELRFKFPYDSNTVSILKASGHFVVEATKTVYCVRAPCAPESTRFTIENTSRHYDLLVRAFNSDEYALRSPADLLKDYINWAQAHGVSPMIPRPWQLEYSSNLIGVSSDSVENAWVCRKNRRPDSITGDCENFTELLNQIRLTAEGGV